MSLKSFKMLHADPVWEVARCTSAAPVIFHEHIISYNYFMHKFYLCELCESSTNRIDTYSSIIT